MDSIIVGTAGHIDHGKTALVKALTGNDTDTLAEEKKRGISINLGFTSCHLPNGRVLGIVDVPGHEKFIKNMLAGAAGIDVAMIVIAANEGMMPQTREHIDILGYLNIQRSLIVLTKIDMVEDDFKELVIEDIRDYIKGTFLEGTKIAEVDSVSCRGIEQLQKELENLTSDLKPRSFSRKARMNIDRIFSVKGYGTVVTGTLIEGILRTEDEVAVYPAGIPSRVRNLQVHDRNVASAYAGQRTAINLPNLSVDQLKRGNTIAKKGGVYVTGRIDVKFSIVKNTKFELGRLSKLKLYIGSSEEVARFIPITHKKVKAGDEGYAQIILDHKIAVLKGDRFVLRTITPVSTIGGGMVVDPNPPKHKNVTEDLIKSFEVKASASDVTIIEEYIKTNPFTTLESISAFLNKEADKKHIIRLLEDESIFQFEGQYVHMEFFAGFQIKLEERLREYHQKNPLKKGIPKAELMGKLGSIDKKIFEWLLQYLYEKGAVKLIQNTVSIPEFSPFLSESQKKIKIELEDTIRESGYTLLTIKELARGSRPRQQVLEYLVQDSFVILPGQYLLSEGLYLKARKAAEALFDGTGAIRLSDFRDAIGASRKYALMILERFDQERFTKRQGEDRVLNNKKK